MLCHQWLRAQLSELGAENGLTIEGILFIGGCSNQVLGSLVVTFAGRHMLTQVLSSLCRWSNRLAWPAWPKAHQAQAVFLVFVWQMCFVGSRTKTGPWTGKPRLAFGSVWFEPLVLGKGKREITHLLTNKPIQTTNGKETTHQTTNPSLQLIGGKLR